MEIAVIILAAGGSQRLGRPKQLLPFHGGSLLRRAAEAAVGSHADHCTVVLGNEADRCGAEISNLPVRLEINPAWREGLASSIRVGVDAVRRHHPNLDAVVLTPCDQPFLTSAVLNSLMQIHLSTDSGIVASSYADTVGIPALFTAGWFQRLTELQGDRGAKALFETAGADLITVPFPQGATDVDTAEDYANALAVEV